MDNNIKIVVDSSSNYHNIAGTNIKSVPLKILIGEKEFIDDAELDVSQMVYELYEYKGKTTTSCPCVSDWLDAFEGSKRIVCITITNTLSGSYNSACVARDTYEVENPGSKVLVIDSLSTGPQMRMIVEKINELNENGCPFENIEEEIDKYRKNLGLVFMLESLKNLSNNGRVSVLKAKMAGLLGIRVIGRASAKGELELLDRCRGEKKALDYIIETMKNDNFKSGRVYIDNCLNKETANLLKEKIENTFSDVTVDVSLCGGLCCFYAEKGGLIIGYEKKH